MQTEAGCCSCCAYIWLWQRRQSFSVWLRDSRSSTLSSLSTSLSALPLKLLNFSFTTLMTVFHHHSVICLWSRFMTVSFLLFSKRSCLQVISSNLCNSSFLISRLLTVSCFYLLFFYPTSFLPIHHAAIYHAVTHDPSIMFTTPYCVRYFSIFLNDIRNVLISLLTHLTYFLHPCPDPQSLNHQKWQQ